MSKGWVGVDLDGTLALEGEWRGSEHIGAPIPAMVERVKRWLEEGRDVRIFTARVSHDRTAARIQAAQTAESAIRRWCLEHLGRVLPVTCTKDYMMVEAWDDRCVQVIANTGEPVGQSTRGLS